jgi:sec-independent protein translocase protein TatA
MPQGSEWLIILVIVVLLFGSAKLPGLVRSLGQSKKAWDDEVAKKDQPAELPNQASNPPVQQQVQQQPQPQAQPQAQQQNTQVNGHNPGDGAPPSQTN